MPEDREVAQSLKIELFTNGEVNVEGPIDDLILSLGMLELAKLVIQQRRAAMRANAENSVSGSRLKLNG